MVCALIVEDSPTQAQSLKIVLENGNIECHIAEDGKRALELLGEKRFDIVISDIVMPGLSGYDLCRRIKTAPQWHNLPVILLTTLKDPMDIVEGLECGADNFFTKPYDPEQLIGRIAHIFENRRLRTEGKLKVGVEIAFLGRTVTINSEREQILDLLITTFEDVVRTNRALEKSQVELAAAKAKIEKYARLVESKLDISEEARTESESQFRESFMNAGHGMALLSLDRRFMSVNPALCRFLGYAEEELLNQPVRSVTHPDDVERDDGEWDRHINEGDGIFNIEKRYIRKDGQVVWTDLSVVLVKDAKGAPKHCVSQALDVTGRKRAEEALRHTNRALRVVSRGNQALVHARSEEELLRDMCRVIVEVGGYRMAWVGFVGDGSGTNITPAAFHGHDHGSLELLGKEPANGGRLGLAMERALRENQMAICSFSDEGSQCCPWRDLAEQCGYRSCAAFPLKQGARTFGVLNIHSSEAGAFHDEELEILRESVADLAFGIVTMRNEREREQAEVALADSQARLRHADKMDSLGNLAGGIAHDFNNMLLPIGTLTEMVLKEMEPESKGWRRLERVLEATNRAQSLAQKILSFSRTDEGQNSTNDISKAVSETVDLLKSTISKTITLDVRIEPDLGGIECDRVQIETIILNLAKNAADAMGSRPGKLQIALNRIDLNEPFKGQNSALLPGSYFCLTIEDTGKGIEPDKLTKIFQPYFTTKVKGKGTGLGLAMVRTIVLKLGGEITVESQVGRGTTFKIYLPPQDDRSVKASPVALVGNEG